MAALVRGSVVGVVGSGAMGAGIAQVAAASGHTVRLYDQRPEAVDRALADIGRAYGKLVEKQRMGAAEAQAALARLLPAVRLADLADAAMVVEAIVEKLEAKHALFSELETVVADDCLLATNTSSISVTAIAAGLRRPERVVGMHFFNPVPLMALVEVVSGLATEAAVAATVHDTATAWGKTPVHAQSTPGFIVNRLARPFYAEGWRLLSERAGDAATIDAVMRETGGFRMGPFELMDLIGHDVNFSVTESVFNACFHDPRFTPSVLQRELVNAGFLGRKSGRGCYAYGDNVQAPQPRAEAPQARPEYVAYTSAPGARSMPASGYVAHSAVAGQDALQAAADAGADTAAAAMQAVHGAREGAPYGGHRAHAGQDVLVAALAARLRQAGLHVAHRRIGEGKGARHGDADTPAFHCNGAAVYLTDGRSATERARANQHPDTIVFDLALDYGSAQRIAIARADQCSQAGYQAVVGMFQAAGYTLTLLDDVPGLAVMRTVAMLANEAADAVNQGVCSARAADLAMQKGVNYPLGPLAWADAVGLDHIVTVLHNLAASYGEDRYRVSPLLSRKQAAGGSFHA
ncbi:3-hydroxyacyl-CoA dehydrogenase [Oxalobacteraceae bacterium A2-2]